jgi:hypothetical protein
MKLFLLGLNFFFFISAFAQTADTAFFGMHNGEFLNQDQKIIFPAMRLWDIGLCWNQLEPQEGKWDFERFDKIVATAQLKHIELVYVLGQTPTWASLKPEDTTGVYGRGANYPPKSITLWENYLKTVGNRYKGKIKYYEIWNEPNFPIFFNGQVADMSALTISAARILKSIDSDIKIISPGIVAGTFDWLPAEKNGTLWMNAYLKITPQQYFDIAGAHFYTPEKASPEKELIPLIRNFRKLLNENGIVKPIWNTEQGYGAMEAARRKSYTGDTATGIAVRTLLINRMEGVERMFWYDWSNRSFCSLHLVAEDGITPTEAAKALAFTHQWLKGKTLIGSETAQDALFLLRFKDSSDKQFGVVWSTADFKLSGEFIFNLKELVSAGGEKIDLNDTEVKASIVPLFFEYKSP